MTLRVKYQETDNSYGTLADLRAFYSYNNPSPVSGPSTTITYYDNLNNSQAIELVGQLPRKNLTPILDGPNAFYFIEISMEAINA